MTMHVLDADALNRVLKNAGLTRTVYALVMPETESVIDSILGDKDSDRREEFRDTYRESWTQKQDAMHLDFFAEWRSWVSGAVTLGGDFYFQYPTAGASEAIREAIYQYAIQSLASGREPVIHVFEAEYEGYVAYAQAAQVNVIKHDRSVWRDTIHLIKNHHQFYVSQPSAIDGNVWDEYDAFMTMLLEKAPAAQVLLDLTYVGCVARDYRIRSDYENILQIFFSLSKPFGLYYHRCGGVLSRRESQGLFGNQWFKNLLSLQIGTEMMRTYGVHDLPTRYRAFQIQGIAKAEAVMGTAVEPCDIFLLGLGELPPNARPIHRYLQRAPTQTRLRICLTPTLAHLANPNLSDEVKVRAHEVLKL